MGCHCLLQYNTLYDTLYSLYNILYDVLYTLYNILHILYNVLYSVHHGHRDVTCFSFRKTGRPVCCLLCFLNNTCLIFLLFFLQCAAF